MLDYIQRASTIHYYEDGSNGAFSWDGDWNTAMYRGVPSHKGPSNINMVSRHTFTVKRIIKQIDFRVSTISHRAACVYGGNSTNNWAYQYWNYDTSAWTTFTGAAGSGTSAAHITLTSDDFGRIYTDKVQMIANASANTNCSGSDAGQETDAYAYIYEMQAWIKSAAYAVII